MRSKITNLLKEKGYSPKFKTQLILSFTIMSFIIITIGTTMIYYRIFDILNKRVADSEMQRILQAEYNIQSRNKEIDRISKLLMMDTDIRSIFHYDESSDINRIDAINNMQKKLWNIMENYDFVYSIYIFGEDGKVYGADKLKIDVAQVDMEKSFFYTSDLYKRIKEDSFKLWWTGGFTSADFDTENPIKTASSSIKLITAARAFRDVTQNINASIVINLYESNYTSNYNILSDQSDFQMYIADDKGKIISSADKKLLLSVSRINEDINVNAGSGNYSYNSIEGTKQIVYKKLEKEGWYIVSEIPFSIYSRDISSMQKTVIGVYTISIALSLIISIYWMYRITKPLKHLAEAMREMEKGNLEVILDESNRNELGLVGRQFNRMTKSINELVEKVKNIEQKKTKYEIKSLRAQINPHFLYNSLNTIKWMAYAAKATNVADAMTALGNMVKPIFKENTQSCKLDEEIIYIENYLKIMNYRYGEGLTLNWKVPDEYREYKVIKFILQPIVENCISHGLGDQKLTLKIDIEVKIDNNNVLIMVSDNGTGIEKSRLEEIRNSLKNVDLEENEEHEDTKKNYNIGLVNINRRIKLYCGNEYGLSIDSISGSSTTVIIKLPILS